jgi:hypothetical protein
MAPIDPAALNRLAGQIHRRLKILGLLTPKMGPIVRQGLIREGKILVVNNTHAKAFVFFLDPKKHPDAFKIPK